ncbi:MAG TPA: hypothetical protein VLE95_00050 [Chlamydiales bacterium]|nr:hypothetical protein [Chlamydiales bacterium]
MTIQGNPPSFFYDVGTQKWGACNQEEEISQSNPIQKLENDQTNARSLQDAFDQLTDRYQNIIARTHEWGICGQEYIDAEFEKLLQFVAEHTEFKSQLPEKYIAENNPCTLQHQFNKLGEEYTEARDRYSLNWKVDDPDCANVLYERLVRFATEHKEFENQLLERFPNKIVSAKPIAEFLYTQKDSSIYKEHEPATNWEEKNPLPLQDNPLKEPLFRSSDPKLDELLRKLEKSLQWFSDLSQSKHERDAILAENRLLHETFDNLRLAFRFAQKLNKQHGLDTENQFMDAKIKLEEFLQTHPEFNQLISSELK